MAEQQKTPQRPPVEIAKDIAAERAGLTSAFDALSGELQQVADAVAAKARTAGRKALVMAPAVAAAAAALTGAAALLRRRRHRDR
jgi:predicted xylose isomerase-like sugar epimerase